MSSDGTNCIDLAEHRDKSRALVDAGNFSTGYTTGGLSSSAQLQELVI
jgi:hypothetical protein